MPEIVRVELGARAYDIVIGQSLLSEFAQRAIHLRRPRRVAIITDEAVATHHLPSIERSFADAGVKTCAIIHPPGESTKSMSALDLTLRRLLDHEIARDDLVVALGGGVIGDLAGFAAAVLRRGVPYVQIPTTLLAQVDSSVGGKTAVNAPHGKNLIGAFHQPTLVVADIDLLETLPPREMRAGYAEIAKYGLLGDAAFFEWLEQNGGAVIAGDTTARIHAVKTSCAAKAAIVARDETEAGDRALLNLGHTFGHALEAATGYSDVLLHGEAVSIGMVLAFEASARAGLCAQEAPTRVAAHLHEIGLPTRLAEIGADLPDADGLMRLMQQDKKISAGRMTFVLARGIGAAFHTQEVALDQIRALLAERLSER